MGMVGRRQVAQAYMEGGLRVSKLLALSAVLVAAFVLGLAPASAITNGTPDGEAHPYVGLMVAQLDDGAPLWTCTGTLISPTIFLTAGHCTEEPAAHVEIWFQSDVESGIPANGFPVTGEVGGTPHTHPDFVSDEFFLHDLGVVVLDEPVVRSEYGALPSEGELSRLGKHASVTAVGYGFQRSFPLPASWKDEWLLVRMVAVPRITGIDNKQVGDYAILVSHDAKRGGICFGDSGGPMFIGDSNVVGGVVSFGTTDTCKGHNAAYRVDQPDDLEWLAMFDLKPS
jgi:Trypsin